MLKTSLKLDIFKNKNRMKNFQKKHSITLSKLTSKHLKSLKFCFGTSLKS
jgi:hypothetical protein